MIFQPDLAAKVLAGEKTQTRRQPGAYAECRYRVGHTYAVQDGRGRPALARIRIVSTRLEPVRAISDADVLAEGFPTVEAFLERWRSIHGVVRGSCWRIEFRLVLPSV